MHTNVLAAVAASLVLAGCAQAAPAADPGATAPSSAASASSSTAQRTDSTAGKLDTEASGPTQTPEQETREPDKGAVIPAGTYLVPDEVPLGVYRVVGYWATLDEDLDTIENDGVYDEGELSLAVIGPDATYVEFSEEAIPLKELPSYPVLELNPAGGTYLVGPDIAPGRYRVKADGYAYAARLDDTLEIIDNDGNDGSVIIVVKATDYAIQFSGTISPL